jgi:hypothetical protein
MVTPAVVAASVQLEVLELQARHIKAVTEELHLVVAVVEVVAQELRDLLARVVQVELVHIPISPEQIRVMAAVAEAAPTLQEQQEQHHVAVLLEA